MKFLKYILIALILLSPALAQQNKGFLIARLQYNGGGDWYNDPSSEVNLLNFIREKTNITVNPVYLSVDISSDEIFSYPFIFITGHGNIFFTEQEADRLRTYLENGGFLYIDDDYGLDASIRREMKKIFPDKDFTELPFDHEIYHILFDFEYGPPKTHKHDEKPPQGFGLFVNNRLAVYYTYESNPSDGWTEAHNDPEEKRLEALKFGTNIVIYALTH